MSESTRPRREERKYVVDLDKPLVFQVGKSCAAHSISLSLRTSRMMAKKVGRLVVGEIVIEEFVLVSIQSIHMRSSRTVS